MGTASLEKNKNDIFSLSPLKISLTPMWKSMALETPMSWVQSLRAHIFQYFE